MKNKILITLVLLIPSLCFGKKFIFLKDNDYKNLKIIIEVVNENHSGIAKEDIQTEIKLLCLQNGMKASFDLDKFNYLYFNLNIAKLNKSKTDVYNLEIEYTKLCLGDIEMSTETGMIFVPCQGNYGELATGYKKENILNDIRSEMKLFLVDYLESNIE